MLRKYLVGAVTLWSLIHPLDAAADIHYGAVLHPVLDFPLTTDYIPVNGHTIETANLAPSGADTVLYVFKRQSDKWVLAGHDDDGGSGYASKVTGIWATQMRVIVVAYDRGSFGTCDVKLNGSLVQSKGFGGAVIHRQNNSWDVGDVFTVVGDRTGVPYYPLLDSVLYILPSEVGGELQYDDDSSLNMQATITATEANDEQLDTHTLVVAPLEGASDGAFMLLQRRIQDTDADYDGISSYDEAELGTSDNSSDSDSDGATDYQELVGVANPAGTAGAYDGSLELRAYYDASPSSPDLFVQYDYCQGTTAPDPNQATWLTSMFTYDTAYTGRTIHVHYESLHEIPGCRYLDFYDCQYLAGHPHPEWFASLFALRNTYLAPRKRSFFKYAVLGQREYSWNAPGSGGGCQLSDSNTRVPTAHKVVDESSRVCWAEMRPMKCVNIAAVSTSILGDGTTHGIDAISG